MKLRGYAELSLVREREGRRQKIYRPAEKPSAGNLAVDGEDLPKVIEGPIIEYPIGGPKDRASAAGHVELESGPGHPDARIGIVKLLTPPPGRPVLPAGQSL